MMNYVFQKSKLICFLFIYFYSNAQNKILAKQDLNQDGIKDVIQIDTVTNKLIIEYGGLTKSKNNDLILFFSNYPAEAGNVHVKVIGNSMSLKFTYSPKYLDYDLMNFKYKKLNNDWILTNIVSSRTNSLSENLMTERCRYIIPYKINFSLKRNDFDQVQENLLDNKKYLVKCTETNLE